MASSRRRLTARWPVAAGVAALVGGSLIAAVPASAASAELVIQEVYGGGGNAGAAFGHDFVELTNHGDAPIDLGGTSLHYGSATGNLGGGSAPGSGNLTLDLNGSIEPGQTFLVQLGGSGDGDPLPEPDAVGSLNLAAASGKVALVNGTDALDCGTACADDPAVIDFVGYGDANDFEGSAPAPRASNSTSVSRADGAADTDDNGADFTAGPPTPTNAAGEGPPPPAEPEEVPIPAIHGAAHVSSYGGELVVTTGVVTAAKYDGFWIQDPEGDGDDATSDGIFVYTGSDGEQPAVGDSVEVSATVQQYRPGSRTGPNLSLTELVDPIFEPLEHQLEMPEPVEIRPSGRTVPPTIAGAAEDSDRIDIEAEGEYDPETDAIAFYKSLEGMLISVTDAEVVGPTNQHGELTVLPAGTDEVTRTSAGGVAYLGYDQPNTARLTIDDEIIYQQMPDANVGDTLEGSVQGPLHYDWGTYRIYPVEIPSVRSGGLQRTPFPPARTGELAVAAFNVENLSPVDSDEKFAALAEQIINYLGAPDILALEEVQDNTGPECPDSSGCEPDGIVDADLTLDLLVAALKEAGGPAYEWRQINPENLADGGQPTGNIRNAFLFRTDRGVEFVDRPGGDATTPTQITDRDGKATLSISPGRVDPQNPAFDNSRKPLVGEFTFRDQPLLLIATHFSSKGGDEPIFGRWQPPHRGSEESRHEQVRAVHDFVAEALAVQPDARVMVLGDINDFEFSTTTSILEGDPDQPTLYSLPKHLLPDNNRYSYVYQGNSQVLDQILVSPSLFGVRATPGTPALARIRAYDIVNVNADFADQVSDHDPQVVHLRLPPR